MYDVVLICLFSVCCVSPLLNGRRRILVFIVLHYGVGDHGQHQNCQQDVEFILQAQKGAVGEGDDKTKRLPHTVISKRCLFLPGEQDAINSCRTESRQNITKTNYVQP